MDLMEGLMAFCFKDSLYQEAESLPIDYLLRLFVICVECCRGLQITWVCFAAKMQS